MGNVRQPATGLPRASRDAEIAPHVLAALAARAPVTVLRGPRGYGKTTAIVRWLDQRWDEVPTAYVPLGAEARRAPGFWRSLRTAVLAAGLADDPGGPVDDPRLATLATLDKHDEPWRLVIDDFHEAGHLDGSAASIDEDLLEMVRANRELELVVATRSLRALETVGVLSVDITVLRPADLALRPAGVVALARRRGIELTLDHAQRLVIELGGWPAALRACVDVAAVGDHEAVVDVSMVDGYLETLLSDLRSESLREFLLRTAVPEEFSMPAARAIVPDGKPVRELRNLREAGVLVERDTVAGPRYSYPPAIRESILRIVAEQRPGLVAEVHRTLFALAAAEEGPVGVLRHAVDAQEWVIALQILEEEWTTLVTRHPSALASLASRFPRELLEAEARVRVARTHLPRMAAAPGANVTEWKPTAARFLELAARGHGGTLSIDEVQVLVQSGTAAIFAGDNDGAVYAFERAADIGIEQDDAAARLIGAGGMLMAKALAGEADLARARAREPELAAAIDGTGGDGVLDVVRVGGRIAYAIACVDALSTDAHQAVDRIVEPQRRDELWALAVYARGLYASAFGSAQERSRAAGALRAAMRHLAPGGIVEATVATMLAELLVSDGMCDVAEHLLDRLGPSGIATPTRAFLLLADGRDQEAIEMAEEGLDGQRLTPRGRHQCELIIAVGLYHLGQETAARRRFARVVNASRSIGQRRAFALVDRAVLEALAGSDPSILSELDVTPTRSSPVDDRSTAEALSDRERDVLMALRHQRGAVGVAAALGMSVNTAKTHLRSVYRKLGATSRDEALRLAQELAVGAW